MATQQLTGRQIKALAVDNTHIATAAAIATTKIAACSANWDLGSNKIVNLTNGTAAGDAINKSQLDAAVTASAAGLAVKAPVRVASTANVTTTYTNTGGTSARGQMTGAPNTLDGVSLAANDRILLKNQSTGAANGIWIVTTLGSGSNGVWDRATDADADAEITDGTFVFVGEGTANAGTQWVLTTNQAIILGGASGTALVFAQFGAGSTYTADETTLTLSTTTFSVKNSGITATQLASDAVTTVKILDSNVTANKLSTDAVTSIKILADAVTTVKILDSNVTANKLSTDAVTSAKILADAVTTVKILDSNVTANKLATDAVTAIKIQADAVTTVKILDSNVTTAKIAALAVTGAKIPFISQTVTGSVNGSNTAFTTSAAAQANSLIVWVNGMRQTVTTHYTYSSSTITFGTAPETGDDVAVFGVTA